MASKHLEPGPGAPTFAYLRDPSGSQFGVSPRGGLMAPDAKGTAPPEQSGGDDPRDLCNELTDDLLYDPDRPNHDNGLPLCAAGWEVPGLL